MAENPRIEELRRRVQADPASIAFAALAEEFRRVGRYEEAIEACRTGLQRHPAYLSARVTLGRALIEMGDFEGAREELTTVLRTAPENLAAIRGLAQIHERMGHSEDMHPDLAAFHAESIPFAAAPIAPPAPPAAPEAMTPVMTREVEPPPSLEAVRPAEPATDFSFQSRREPVAEIGFDFPSAPPKEKAPAAPVEPAHASRRIDPFASFVAPEIAAPSKAEPTPALTPIPIRMPERLPTPVVSRPAPPEPSARPDSESALEAHETFRESTPELDALSAAGADSSLRTDSPFELASGPARELETESVLHLAPASEFSAESAFHLEPEEPVEAAQPFTFDLASAPTRQSPAESAIAFDHEPEPEPEPEPDLSDIHVHQAGPAPSFVEGPDPEVVATLARLEHFLAAIQHARHA
jgi:tetratricopeptide (TPR) repeat protein